MTIQAIHNIVFPSSVTFLRSLQCARLWSAKPNERREHIEGVHLERVRNVSGDDHTFMVATNGHAMWVRGRGSKSNAFPHRFHVDLTRYDVEALIGVLKASRGDQEVTVYQLPSNEVKASIGKTDIGLEASGGVDSTFPAWRNVLPKPSTSKKACSTGHFSADLLQRAFRSLKPPTGSFATRFAFGEGELDPLTIRGVVAGEPAMVVIMPMRGAYDEHGSPV